MGTRLIEDFLARSNLPRCTDLTQTAEIISKVGFKSFLNVVPSILPVVAAPPPTASGSGGSQEGRQEFGLVLDENPLAEMVELPEAAVEGGLWFSNILCGVLRGALEMVRVLLCLLRCLACMSASC